MAALTGHYAGVVMAIDGTTAKIRVKRVGGDNIYLARIVQPITQADAAFGATSLALGDDTLPLRPLQAGDEVLVGFLEGRHDAPVVLGRLA